MQSVGYFKIHIFMATTAYIPCCAYTSYKPYCSSNGCLPGRPTVTFDVLFTQSIYTYIPIYTQYIYVQYIHYHTLNHVHIPLQKIRKNAFIEANYSNNVKESCLWMCYAISLLGQL